MNKIKIQDVSLEIVGNVIKLNYPSHYTLDINSNNTSTSYSSSSMSSLASQIEQVERNSSGFQYK